MLLPKPDLLLSRSPLRWNLERMLLEECDPSGHAAEILQEALDIDLESAAERNVIALLTARTAAVLAAAGGDQQIPETALNATEPLERNLLQIWQTISGDGNTPLVLRCPY
jgi:hypothetical protein